MTRQEHLKWCKERAIQEMDYYNDPTKGIISMASDLRKHPETNDEILVSLCMSQLLTKPNMTRIQVINFLNGFK